jgi:TolA-binding protein
MFRRLIVPLLLVAPALSFAANKEMQELQRDVAQLQDQMRQLQQSQDRQLAALTTLVQQAVDASNRANTTVAVIQSNLQQSLRDQEGKVAPLMAGVNTRLDNVSNDVRTMQQAVSDLTTVLSKIQAQITDLGNAVKVMQTPAPPPPGAPATPAAGGTAAAEVPPIGASDLYANAMRDRSSGKLDLALQEFSDYLKYYGNTDLAPNAQFYIGMIHYSQSDFETAAQDFDVVLEKYSENSKTEDSLYYKGMSLLRVPGHKTQAGDEFRELIKEFPNTDRAKEACTQLTNLGYNTCRFPASAPKRGSAKKK